MTESRTQFPFVYECPGCKTRVGVRPAGYGNGLPATCCADCELPMHRTFARDPVELPENYYE